MDDRAPKMDLGSRFDPQPHNLKVGRGVFYTGIGQLVKIVSQLLSLLILARLLSPSDFGIVAMCSPVLAFVILFQDLGLTQAVIQKSTLGSAEISFLFWVNLSVSVVIGVSLALLAPLVATFYRQPEVAFVVMAMAAQLFISGLGTQHYALLNRRMELGRLAAIESISLVCGNVASILWALSIPSYWAIVVGGMVSTLTLTVAVWLQNTWRPSTPRAVDGVRSLLHFGAGLTGFNLSNFFARNLDNVMIGRWWGDIQLGLYDRAYKLLLLPLSQITNPLSKVMIPLLSRLHDKEIEYSKTFLRTVSVILLLLPPTIAISILMSDALIPLLLGERWQDTATIFQALGFAGLIQPLNQSIWMAIYKPRAFNRIYDVGSFQRRNIRGSIFHRPALRALGVAIAYAASDTFVHHYCGCFYVERGLLH